MDQTFPQPQKRLPKALAVITGIIALVVALAWFAFEYSDVLWPDQAYKSAWYLGSDSALYALSDGVLTKIPGMPEQIGDVARTESAYALIAKDEVGAYVYLNGERVASEASLRDVAISPNGTQVAFARSATGTTAPSAWEIVRIKDGEAIVVAKGFSPYFVDETHLIYFDEKGVWLTSDTAPVTQLSGITFSNVETTMTAQSPNRTGLMWTSDITPVTYVFSMPSVEPLEFTAMPLVRTVPMVPVIGAALSNESAYALHEGAPTFLWIHSSKHPEGRSLLKLEGAPSVTAIIFAP